MNKKLLLVLVISVMAKSWLAAQDTIPDLIISEQRMDWSDEAYIELTNMGDTALDLSLFMVASPHSSNNNFYFAPNTMLSPKESYVLCNKWEEPGRGWVNLQQLADQFVFPEEPLVPGDSISVGEYVLRTWNGRYSSQLWYLRSEVDSIVIDCFNWNRGDDGTDNIKSDNPIAGVVFPVANNTLVRKISVTEGNLGNFEADRGVDATDSNWQLVDLPNYNQGIPFTTVGSHGEYPIVASSANPDVVIDLDNGTLTVPWGIYKGDSIVRELTLGEGMAWTYVEKAVFEDSVHNVIQTGDMLQLKSLGEMIQVKDLLITVSPPASDMNKAFPLKNIGPLDAEDPTSIQVIKGTRYYVTEGMPVIDTIGDVPFAARVDTLFTYIEWASNANAKIIWKDGSERVDLVNGDILEVTAEDESKKQYYIDVQDYSTSDNVALSAITWPDITTEDIMFDLNWVTDTLPGFAPNKVAYTVKLRSDSKNVPAFKAYAQDLNAKISYKPAISLKGGFEERTTVITVTSESDTLTMEYAVTFEVDVLDEHKQKFFAEPLLTEHIQRTYTKAEALEIANPGTEPLDLSQYLITRGNGIDALASLTQDLDSANRYRMYVPGYRFTDDGEAWDGTGFNGVDYKKLVTFDGDVNPEIAPGDVFLIGGGEVDVIGEKSGMLTEPEDWEITFPMEGGEPNVWGQYFDKGTGLTVRNPDGVYYLWKIENDSIFDGTKAIGDPNDLTLIDALGRPDGLKFSDIAGYDGGTGGGLSVIRKSSVYEPNDSYILSGGTTPEESEWIVRDRKVYGWDAVVATLGNQVFDPITAYLSTVSSLLYSVDDGYQGNLGITGIGGGETVQQFYDNLIIADTAMDISVKSSTDGAIRDLADPVAQGDTLIVIAADGNTTTKYELDLTPLDDNTNLVPSDGSELTVADGAVSGFDQDATLESVLAGVKTESDLSILNIMDADGALIPLKKLDTNGEYQPVLASAGIIFEVLAQNGDKAQYQLTPNSAVEDAFVLSSIYEVSQDYFIISGIPGGTAVSAFMDNIVPAEGASVKIIDKLDYDRTLGNLAYDDLLVVVSSDGSKTVTYMLNFMEELSAYVTSTVFPIDQDAASIVVPASTTVETLIAGLTPAPSSVMTVLDVDMAEKTTGEVLDTDMVKVVSGDGRNEVSYTIEVLVSVYNSMIENLKVYPNPASDVLYVENIPSDSHVRISDITGRMLMLKQAGELSSGVDLSGMQRGIYFLTVEKDGKVVATVKFVKK